MKCPRCKQKKQPTKHHIFSYHQVRKELLRIYDRPVTEEEHKKFQDMIRSMHRKIPKVEICEECHQEIEKKKQPIKVRNIWR